MDRLAADATAALGSPAGLDRAAMNFGRDDDGNPLSFPYAIPADGMRVHDAYNVGWRNVLRSDAAIAFRIQDHGQVGENTLFFGPYLSLPPGEYTIRMNGDVEGRVRLRLTRSFASECLLETTVESFKGPIRLRLTNPAEKFEIIGDRVDDTRSMTLRAIEIVRRRQTRNPQARGRSNRIWTRRSTGGIRLPLQRPSTSPIRAPSFEPMRRRNFPRRSSCRPAYCASGTRTGRAPRTRCAPGRRSSSTGIGTGTSQSPFCSPARRFGWRQANTTSSSAARCEARSSCGSLRAREETCAMPW